MDTERIHDLRRLMAEADIDGDELRERYETYSSIDDELALSQLREKLEALTPVSDGEEPSLPSQPRQSRWVSFLGYAAAVAAVVVVVGGLLWYRQYTAVEPPVLSEQMLQAMKQSQQSGRTEGIRPQPLELRAKRAVADEPLSPADEWIEDVVEMIQQPEASVQRAALSIDTRDSKEYWLTLPDGSVVHLNNGTRVIYPEEFVGDHRDVILDGEAYFMVAKDRRHPFVVHTYGGDVKAYGTEFNVSTRHHQAEVVLVEGSVGVTLSNTSYERMLKPGQMATLSSSGTLSVENVDVQPYVAWNTGSFVFDNIPMQQLMDVLSRWYGLTVEFRNPDAKEKHFTGELDRYGSIMPTLDAIGKVTGLTLSLSDDHLVVR